MARARSLNDLSFDELRNLMIEKRRAHRQERLDYFSSTGKVIYDKPLPRAKTSRYAHDETWLVDDGYGLKGTSTPRKRSFFDRFLLFVEVAAAIGLVFITISGINAFRNLNQEVSQALIQPTLTPTPLIMAVVLPSGHTPPQSPGGVRPNDAEIPEHLRPLIQSLPDIPVPTPGPKQAVRIQIPAIGVDKPVVQGDAWEQLKKGVGQHVGSPNPGESGNIVLSAHNDIFGEIFRDLDLLEEGDSIILFSSQRTYTYIVQQTQIVEPTQVEVMASNQEPIVTLISCYPYMVDDKRIVVTAVLQN